MQLLIIIFICLSYFMGIKAILQNKYRPSLYSRIIWFLLAINSFAAVILLKSTHSVILLAGLTLLGTLIILLLSFRKSIKMFGSVEIISTILLIICLTLWIVAKLPFLNLSIGLLIAYIGGLPTLKQVINDPNSEDLFFWLFFSLASLITLISADKLEISDYLYPLCLAIFNSCMTILCLRRYIS